MCAASCAQRLGNTLGECHADTSSQLATRAGSRRLRRLNQVISSGLLVRAPGPACTARRAPTPRRPDSPPLGRATRNRMLGILRRRGTALQRRFNMATTARRSHSRDPLREALSAWRTCARTSESRRRRWVGRRGQLGRLRRRTGGPSTATEPRNTPTDCHRGFGELCRVGGVRGSRCADRFPWPS